MLFAADIREGVTGRFRLSVSRKKQRWQTPSFKSMANRRSWQRPQVSIRTRPIDVLKSCIYCHSWAGGGQEAQPGPQLGQHAVAAEEVR